MVTYVVYPPQTAFFNSRTIYIVMPTHPHCYTCLPYLQALLINKHGQGQLVDGPRRVSVVNKSFRKLQRLSANQKQYIRVQRSDGNVEHISGCVWVWHWFYHTHLRISPPISSILLYPPLSHTHTLHTYTPSHPTQTLLLVHEPTAHGECGGEGVILSGC